MFKYVITKWVWEEILWDADILGNKIALIKHIESNESKAGKKCEKFLKK